MRVGTSVCKLAAALTLCLCLDGGSALPWEFSMEGEFNRKKRFVQQLGSRGFIGKYDQDNGSTPGDFASVTCGGFQHRLRGG
jgi:hypothetical protein